MPVVRHFSKVTSFSPEKVKMMGEVFEDVWVTVENAFSKLKTNEITLARATLARRIIGLAERGHYDPDVLTAMARKSLTVVARPTAHRL